MNKKYNFFKEWVETYNNVIRSEKGNLKPTVNQAKAYKFQKRILGIIKNYCTTKEYCSVVRANEYAVHFLNDESDQEVSEIYGCSRDNIWAARKKMSIALYEIFGEVLYFIPRIMRRENVDYILGIIQNLDYANVGKEVISSNLASALGNVKPMPVDMEEDIDINSNMITVLALNSSYCINDLLDGMPDAYKGKIKYLINILNGNLSDQKAKLLKMLEAKSSELTNKLFS